MIGMGFSSSSAFICSMISRPVMCGIWMSMMTRSAERRGRAPPPRAVAHRLGLVAVRAQQVAEELQIEFVVLDNEDFLSHAATLSDEDSGLKL
jgi:hypothetical protein